MMSEGRDPRATRDIARRDAWSAEVAAICVPVRNEEALLPALLCALDRQEAPAGVDVALCFLLDDCHDASGDILARYAARSDRRVKVETMCDGGAPNAGRARRRAMALGQSLLGGRRGALLSTDADSVPAPDWIAAACRRLRTCDVVAGRIVRDTLGSDPRQDRLEAYYDRLYALRRRYDPVTWEASPAHHHVGGANLAFRDDAYAALGGFVPRPAGEDAAIVDQAHRIGLRVGRDRVMVVETSARRHGRAVDGLADHLRAIDDVGDVQVAHPAAAAWQYRAHGLSRKAHGGIDTGDVAGRLAAALGMTVAHVRRVAADTANVEAFVTHVVPAGPGSGRLVSLSEAEAALAELERSPYERAA